MSTEHEQYAIVELLGHRTIAGRIHEVDYLGVKMLHIDVLMGGGQILPERISAGALYCVTEVSKETAEIFISRNRYMATQVLGIQPQLPSASEAISGLAEVVSNAGGLLPDVEELDDEDRLTITGDDFKGFLSSLLDDYEVDDDTVPAVADLVCGGLRAALEDFEAAMDKQSDEKKEFDPEWAGDPDAEKMKAESGPEHVEPFN